jgi:hypothetical protein
MLMAAEGTRQLELKAFKRPAGAIARNRGMHQHRPAGMSGALHHQPPQELAGYQQSGMQQGMQQGMLQQGGYGATGQLLQRQQGMLAGEHANTLWLQASGVSAAPPGLAGMGPGGQLAALAAVTAAMSSAPANAYSMQQLLYMLPPQQQMGAGMASPGGGTWQGNMMLPGGAVSLSSNSNLDATLQSLQGGTDPSMLAPSVSAAGLLAPAGGGYTGWLG